MTHPRRNTLPLTPESYRAAARRARRFADRLEAGADAETPRQRAALTGAINGLSRWAQQLSRRHRRAMGIAPDGDES